MTYSRSPESPNRRLRKIELPEEIKTFFAKRSKFVRGIPSYEQIEGVNPENHEQCFDYIYGHPIPIVETHPVNNTDKEEYRKAQERTKELLKLFFGVHQADISEPLREYMLTGGTKPIRVTTHISEKWKRMYVKLPSIERIIGLSLYNLISGKPPIDFLFSEYVFVEDSVPGRHIDDTNISYFQRLERLGRGIIEARTQDRFLGINDLDREVDLPNSPRNLVNLLVQSDGDIALFDVDCAFTKSVPSYDLVDLLRKRGIIISPEMEKKAEKEEARRILKIIRGTSRKAYEKFVELMDKIPFLIEQFSKIGFKSARVYFDEKEKWLSSKS